jgi:hypothetical protein
MQFDQPERVSARIQRVCKEIMKADWVEFCTEAARRDSILESRQR